MMRKLLAAAVTGLAAYGILAFDSLPTASAAGGASYQNTVLGNGPSLYWRMTETSGSVANDSTSNGNTGRYVGSYTLGHPGPVSGDTAVALGTTGAVESGYDPFKQGSSITVEGWANASNAPSSATLFASDLAPSNTNPWLYFDSPGQIGFYPENGSEVTWSYTWPVGQWVMWDLTYNDSTHVADLFIDGQDEGTRTASQGYASTTGNFELGAGAGASCFFPGSMGEVSVYNKILSASQIAADYAAATGIGSGSGAQMGVKYWTGNLSSYNPFAGTAVSAFGGSSQIYEVINPNEASSGTDVVVEVDAGSSYGSAGSDYTDDASLAAKLTGGNGGWYAIGNEPEDMWSDDVAPGTYATQLHSWVTAIRAVDANAKFAGPSLTSWMTASDSNYPWGSPEQWFQTMYNDYETDYGAKPPFSALSVHAYVNPSMNTVSIPSAGSQNYLSMINSFSQAAQSYGYPAQVWVTESGVEFPQDVSVPLSAAQQQTVTAYMNDLLTDPDVGRAYYFQGGFPGWNIAGGAESVRGPFSDASGDRTEVAAALQAAVP